MGVWPTRPIMRANGPTRAWRTAMEKGLDSRHAIITAASTRRSLAACVDAAAVAAMAVARELGPPLSECKEAKINSFNLRSSTLPDHIQAPFLSNPISPNGGHHTENSMLHAHGPSQRCPSVIHQCDPEQAKCRLPSAEAYVQALEIIQLAAQVSDQLPL
nr:unnamed protein product [Digitaria exilis]